MSTNNLKPEKVTKPIQLLAAWLLGLVLINSSFLLGASNLTNPSWGAGALIIAAIANVPIFLISLFILQTKFRPEMQEDTYYSKYLDRKYAGEIKKNEKSTVDDTNKVVSEIMDKINSLQQNEDKEKQIKEIIKKRDFELIKNQVRSSRSLSEAYLYSNKWSELIDSWGSDEGFLDDTESALKHGVLTGDIKNPKKIKLTKLGKDIATELEKENQLWNQVHKERHMND